MSRRIRCGVRATVRQIRGRASKIFGLQFSEEVSARNRESRAVLAQVYVWRKNELFRFAGPRGDPSGKRGVFLSVEN